MCLPCNKTVKAVVSVNRERILKEIWEGALNLKAMVPILFESYEVSVQCTCTLWMVKKLGSL